MAHAVRGTGRSAALAGDSGVAAVSAVIVRERDAETEAIVLLNED